MINPVSSNSEIILLCGCGGVGKTSIAASLAFLAARNGKNTLAFTVDPARRLADTLGIRLDQPRPAAIPLGDFRTPETGTFSALMFNVEMAASDLIHRYADSRDRAQKILDNAVFKLAIRQITGTEEYLALGKLHQLLTDYPTDLMVVDTAPSRHALDFLKGPDRLLQILDPSIMKRLKSPVKRFIATGGVTGAGPGSILARIAMRIAGREFVDAATELATHLSTMYSDFKDRVHDLHQTLRDPDRTRIILVTTPCPTGLADARSIHEELVDAGYRPDTILFNRVTPHFNQQVPNAAKTSRAAWPPAAIADKMPDPEYLERLIRELPEFLGKYRIRVENETMQMNRFLKECPYPMMNYRIPLLPGDVNSLNDLERLHPYLAECLEVA